MILVAAVPLVAIIVLAIIVLACNYAALLRGLYASKTRNLPKGIVLSSEDLTAHADILRSQRALPPAKLGKMVQPTLTNEAPSHRGVEVVLAEEAKRSVYVFDANLTKTYVVVELQNCPKGPPLLPPGPSDEGRWSPPEDQYMHLGMYLIHFMRHLRQQDWSDRILSHIDGKGLVRYQAAVPEQDWRELWDALLKPFQAQRTAYRGSYRTKKAPELFFGVIARFSPIESTPPPSTPSTEDQPSLESSTSPPSSGIQMPEDAAEWLEFWGHQDLPQQRTFIEFASNLDQAAFGRRSASAPDLSLPVLQDECLPLPAERNFRV
jgi:hypothetical protein